MKPFEPILEGIPVFAQANAVYRLLAPGLTQDTKERIDRLAQQLATRAENQPGLTGLAVETQATNGVIANFSQVDIGDLVLLVLMQATNDQDGNLKSIMEQMKKGRGKGSDSGSDSRMPVLMEALTSVVRRRHRP